MRISTFSIVVGTPACDAHCPFCVSHMTGFDQLPPIDPLNERNLQKAVRLAEVGGATTVLLTGKGEPTLYPDLIRRYLVYLDRFPLIELQTNAIRIGHIAELWERADRPTPRDAHVVGDPEPYNKFCHELADRDLKRLGFVLPKWHEQGLNTIAISAVDVLPEPNRKIYLNHRVAMQYPPLETTVKLLHGLGYTVRLTIMMHRGYVDSLKSILRVAAWCKKNGVAQLTVRPLRVPQSVAEGAEEKKAYVHKHTIELSTEMDIIRELEIAFPRIANLRHGSFTTPVFDVDGQNLCFADCLTIDHNEDEIRTLIYYNGQIRYSWEFDGARLL